MPVFDLKPWEGDIELEMCGAQFCLELRDRGHSVHAFYEEYGDRGGIVLMVDLQKRENYKEYVKKFIELDLPNVLLDAPNDTNSEFYTAYKSALALYKEKERTSIFTHWESGDIPISFTIMISKRSVDIMLRIIYGPYRLYLDADVTTKKVAEAVERLVKNAAGLYLLFKEYVLPSKT